MRYDTSLFLAGEEEVLWRGDRNEQQNEAMLYLRQQCWENFEKKKVRRKFLWKKWGKMRLFRKCSVFQYFSISWWEHWTRIIGPKAVSGFWNEIHYQKKSRFFGGVYKDWSLFQSLVCFSHLPPWCHGGTPSILRYVKRETSESPSYVNRLLAALFADETWSWVQSHVSPIERGFSRWCRSGVVIFYRKFAAGEFWVFLVIVYQIICMKTLKNNTNLSNLSESVFFLLNFIEVRVARYPEKNIGHRSSWFKRPWKLHCLFWWDFRRGCVSYQSPLGRKPSLSVRHP